MRYARIHDGAVAEIISLPDDVEVADAFHADIAATLVACPDTSVGEGYGYAVDAKGKVTFTPPAPLVDAPVDLPAFKAGLKAQIDAAAEALRLTLITPGSGQAMEYQEAYAQARAALQATGDVNASDYPMLAVTIGVDIDPQTKKPATDVLGVARSVKAAYEAYLQAGAAIRGARLLAKAEIEAAADAELAQAVFAAIKWPTFTA
ncbi:hypothetical protein ABIE45_004523 [Methylobacterium sp. OAE515]|uniref:hypothetical protein n=1 Tax=Methylobacterium sp. OAE515 TaxID=2817895 RepID=UPI00178A6A9A